MKIILTRDIDTLGRKGEVLDVKDGYGRNFLIPRGMAVVATASNIRRYEEESNQQALKLEQIRKDAEALANRLNTVRLTFEKLVGEEGRIFGSVTTSDIAEALNSQGYDLDRRKISLSEDIRAVGEYTATVRIDSEFSAGVTVEVIGDAKSAPAEDESDVAEPEATLESEIEDMEEAATGEESAD